MKLKLLRSPARHLLAGLPGDHSAFVEGAMVELDEPEAAKLLAISEVIDEPPAGKPRKATLPKAVEIEAQEELPVVAAEPIHATVTSHKKSKF